MFLFDVRNVGYALPSVLAAIPWKTVPRESRNGPVHVFPEPVTTVYRQPKERVIFWEKRDANPFFHFFESLWMLAGRNDVKYPATFAKAIAQYSDDGRIFNAAYGYRWRNYFGKDQLQVIIDRLRADPEDRRSVLQIWSSDDLGKASKDLPCNLTVTFQRNARGSLDMTVFNRSNDIIWGAYGANAVHFSYLQEYVASCIGCEVGDYWQVSANFHAYEKTYAPLRDLPHAARLVDEPYTCNAVQPFPLMQTPQKTWDQDLAMFLEDPYCVGFRDPFFRRVAIPLWAAHAAYRTNKGTDGCAQALEILGQCAATDWRRAAEEWIMRRREERVARATKQKEEVS